MLRSSRKNFSESKFSRSEIYVGNLASKFFTLRMGILGAGLAMFGLEKSISKGGTSMANASQILETPSHQLQAMSLAANRAGVNPNALQSAQGTLQTA